MIHSGAGLSFQNMVLEGIPEGANSSKAGDNVIPDLAIWPSVSAEPGATVRSRLWPYVYSFSATGLWTSMNMPVVPQAVARSWPDCSEVS